MSEAKKPITSEQLALRLFLITLGGAAAFIGTVILFVL